MGSLSENIAQAINDFDGIQQAIESKGVAVPFGTPTSEYAHKISRISASGDEWTRPLDRPAKPLMCDNMVLMLFGVSANSPNDMAFLFQTSAGQYHVDWGDGESNNYNSNTIAEHLYDFGSITTPVDSRGYKLVWITVTPVSGNITAVNTYVRHSLRPAASGNSIFAAQVFEVYIQCPYLTSLYWTAAAGHTRYTLMDIFSLDVNQITAPTYLLMFCSGLKQIDKLEIGNMQVINSLLRGCVSYNEELPFPTNLGNIGSHFMYDCTSYNKPITQEIKFAGDQDSFFYNCNAYNHTLTVDLSQSTNPSFVLTNTYALKGLRLLNMGLVQNVVNVSNKPMEVPALTALFSDLADRSQTTSGTITITGCFGASRLTPADKAVATVKNWVVVG